MLIQGVLPTYQEFDRYFKEIEQRSFFLGTEFMIAKNESEFGIALGESDQFQEIEPCIRLLSLLVTVSSKRLTK